MTDVAPGHVRECPACKAGSPASAGGYHVLSLEGELKQPDRGDVLVADLMGERVDSHLIDEFIEQEQRRIEELFCGEQEKGAGDICCVGEAVAE